MNITSLHQNHAVPTPKLIHKRGTPKRVNRGKFSPQTITHIFERDGFSCVRCRRSTEIESAPHHIIFKSQGGKGERDNGATTCRPCHDWAHGKAYGPDGEPKNEGRKWFEDYRNAVLIPYYKVRENA
jgi:5-methylcytosine-specific restriction endonuclease McrA